MAKGGFLFAAMAAGIASASAFWAWQAAEAGRRQAEYARRSYEAGERSAVFFGNVRLQRTPQQDGMMKEAFLVPIGNSGGTTTQNLAVRLACRPSSRTLADPFSRAELSQAKVQNLVLAPKQDPLPAVACAYTLGELFAGAITRASVYVFGEAIYNDTIEPGFVHHIEFCTRMHAFVIGFPGIYALSGFCTHHNCADRGCSEATAP